MMRTTPLVMGLIYTFMGILFTYLAIGSAEKGIWDFTTIVLMIVATFDFGVAIRVFILHYKIKKIQKNKK
ncbi:YdiK family protein [Bacillus songklensis]|uniref:YdiK family protein n=1 Tax=Bacillus songklensis TaxID=1069116 RepID=A0ABV8B2D2_9BACI